MKFEKFLKNSSSDDDFNKFRQLSINLVEQDTNNRSIVDKVCDKYLYDKNEIINLVEDINNLLKKHYTGKKYIFDLCLNEESLSPDVLNIRTKSKVKKEWFEKNDKLEEIKSKFETYLSLYK